MKKLPSWYPDWDAIRARPYMSADRALVGAMIAVGVFLQGARLFALVLVAFIAVLWFAEGKRR